MAHKKEFSEFDKNNPYEHKNDKNRFTKNQLAEAFGLTPPTIMKMIGETLPVGKKGVAPVWDICDVSRLIDVRDKAMVDKAKGLKPDSDDYIETNPDKMKPADRRVHYQAEDLKQAALLKSRKNAVESRELIPAGEVEMALATAFKTIALTLDTLPDALERDGMINSSDIESVINILDHSREQLANDLAKLSSQALMMNMLGDW